MMTANHRQNPRAEIGTTAVVLARHNDGIPFTIESISIGGARLVGPLTLTIGERISVLFEIAGHPVDVKAEVIRVDVLGIAADKIGVRFVHVSADTRALIHDLVLWALEQEEELLVRGED